MILIWDLIVISFVIALVVGYIIALFTMPLIILPATLFVMILKGE